MLTVKLFCILRLGVRFFRFFQKGQFRSIFEPLFVKMLFKLILTKVYDFCIQILFSYSGSTSQIRCMEIHNKNGGKGKPSNTS